MAEEWKKTAFEDDCILNTVLTTQGDLLTASANDTPSRLGIGSANQVLNVNGDGDMGEWQTWDLDELAHHSSTHQHDGDDVINMDDLEAAGPVDFNGQQAKDLVIHKASSTPTPVVGKPYFDNEDLAIYFCTSAA